MMVAVSASARWSSQRIMLRSSSESDTSEGVGEGVVVKEDRDTGMGASVSCARTAREQVASKPMPLMESGGAEERVRMRRMQVLMARQMSVVDCSWREGG